VAAVLLSGALHDGSLGLAAVKRCGGITLVQAPRDASYAEMPTRALAASKVDHCVPGAEMGALLLTLVHQPRRESAVVPEELRLEARLALNARESNASPAVPPALDAMGRQSGLVCPECSGPLWQVPHHDTYGYRCHTGHAYNQPAMLAHHTIALERALWVAIRTLTERGILLDRLIEDMHRRGQKAPDLEQRRRELDQHVAAVRGALAAASPAPTQEQPEADLGHATGDV
jgi:two-component system chemotaxis response regulator CheB